MHPNRQQPFARSSSSISSSTGSNSCAAAVPVVSSTSGARLGTKPGTNAPVPIVVPTQEQVHAYVQKAKTCAKPDDYLKCVVNNYAIAASGHSVPFHDCDKRCAPVTMFE